MDCLACGPTDRSRSNEHVFAGWLLDFLKARKVRTGLARGQMTGESTVVRKDIELNSFTLNRICEGCNNAWMHRLEERAMPILKKLLPRTATLGDLDRDERRILARWAAKTAIVESYAVGAGKPVDLGPLKWMRGNEDGAPGRFAVVAYQWPFDVIGHLQAGILQDLIGGGVTGGNIVALGLPNLILISGFPLEGLPYDCRCDLTLFTPLWPEGGWTQLKGPFGPLNLQAFEDETVFRIASRVELFQTVK